MFTAFKESVIASRIHKASFPVHHLTVVSCDAYSDLITAYCGITKKVLTEVSFLVSRHADEIAKAIVILEPVIRDIKAHPAFKQIKAETESMIETFTETHNPAIERYMEEVTNAIKGKE